MKVMVMVKATPTTETGVMPGGDILARMMDFNERLVKAGILLAGEGLHPSTQGVKILNSGGTQKIVDGPFAETKEMIAGFWLWQVRSLEEAVEWARQMPQVPGAEQDLEIRRVLAAEDFGEAFTPELQAQEEKIRQEAEHRQP